MQEITHGTKVLCMLAKFMMNIDEAVLIASGMVKVPKRVTLNGKYLPWDLLISPFAGRSIVGYLAESLSYTLFDESKVGFSLQIDNEAMTGMRMVEDIRLSANDVLLLAEANKQLAMPSINNPNYDYSDLFLTFRDVLMASHSIGDKVDIQHPILVSHLHENLGISHQIKPVSITISNELTRDF